MTLKMPYLAHLAF